MLKADFVLDDETVAKAVRLYLEVSGFQLTRSTTVKLRTRARTNRTPGWSFGRHGDLGPAEHQDIEHIPEVVVKGDAVDMLAAMRPAIIEDLNRVLTKPDPLAENMSRHNGHSRDRYFQHDKGTPVNTVVSETGRAIPLLNRYIAHFGFEDGFKYHEDGRETVRTISWEEVKAAREKAEKKLAKKKPTKKKPAKKKKEAKKRR